MIGNIPPALPLILGALLIPLLRGKLRAAYMIALPIVSLVHLLGLPVGDAWHWSLPIAGGDELAVVRIDKLSLLFGYLFHIAALIAVIYSLHVKDVMQHVAGVIYAGSALGAVFAGDFITLFVFWELLAVSSAFLIWARRTESSYRAGMRYLIIQVTSGVMLLAGIILRYQETQTLDIGPIAELDGAGSMLIFLAIGIKCAFPLFHNWLTDAYPAATPTGTVFMSAFTTKVAVYALARIFPGVTMMFDGEPVKVLVYIGATMTAFPIFFAVIENDLRRVLGYSMINQIGFMVVGVGIGTPLALDGAVAHAFNDVIFKGLLFMSMGAVLHRTGKINGSELGGLFKSMPKTAVLCMVGAASISAFPLFSGFVSKSMVMSAALDEGHTVVWLFLLFAAAGVFHHAGIKIPFFAFFAHDSGIRCKEAPVNMLIAMSIGAALCLFNGCFPNVLLYPLLPNDSLYHPYTMGHIVSQMQVLCFSALAFVWLQFNGLYPPELRSTNLDAEWTYRRLLPNAAGLAHRVLGGLHAIAARTGIRIYESVMTLVQHLAGPQGVLARNWFIGTGVLCALVFLGLYLLYRFSNPAGP